MRSLAATAGRAIARALDRAGIIKQSRVRAVTDLAWPRVVTGFARMSQQAADVAMVGLAVGPTAVTGLAFAYTFWMVGEQLALGLSGGTISLVSQYFGADDERAAGQALKQSIWVALALSLPLALVFGLTAASLIGLFTTDPGALRAGTTYLQLLAITVPLAFLNKLGSRAFAGIDDTVTPMVIRSGAALLNILFNAVLIFGFDLGVAGAAIGTNLAIALSTALFAWGLLGRRYPRLGAVPLRIPLGRPQLHPEMIRSLLSVAAPLMIRRVVRAGFRFPLLAIVAVFGPLVVAAFEIGRRVRNLMNALTWGFSIAGSSLVGRHLGAENPAEAKATSLDILRLSAVSYFAVAALVILLAPWIARVFVSDPETIDLAIPFIRVGALATIGMGMDGSATGVLRGGGDTTWTFYATAAGMYLVALPLGIASVATGVGVLALYTALVAETVVPALIMLRRYAQGVWLQGAHTVSTGD